MGGQELRLPNKADSVKFAVIGDSGQQDPEIYRAIVQEFPDRILAVYAPFALVTLPGAWLTIVILGFAFDDKIEDDLLGGIPGAGAGIIGGGDMSHTNVITCVLASLRSARFPAPRSYVTVSITGDLLVIKGERRFEQEVKEQSFLHVERAYGKFERLIQLPWRRDVAWMPADTALRDTNLLRVWWAITWASASGSRQRQVGTFATVLF